MLATQRGCLLRPTAGQLRYMGHMLVLFTRRPLCRIPINDPQGRMHRVIRADAIINASKAPFSHDAGPWRLRVLRRAGVLASGVNAGPANVRSDDPIR